MIPVKRILKYTALYLVCVAAITTIVYLCIVFFAQKTFHLDKKQWHPAEPETQQINPTRLDKALQYIDTRLPTARSLLLIRNGKTVVEQYYWRGGPEATDFLHALNLPLLQVLIGIAIDQHLIQGPAQPLSEFFPDHVSRAPSDPTAGLTLNDLLRVQASLMMGEGNSDYWNLLYAHDRIETALQIISPQKQTDGKPASTFAAIYLLSRVIEKVSGHNIFSFADRHLFQPLGITTYAAEDKDLPHDPMVGFQLKALDLAKIGYLLSQKGIWENRRVVSEKWISDLFLEAFQTNLDHTLGGSWVKTTLGGHESIMARGDGGQYLVLIPSLDLVVVTTSKSRFPLPQDNGHDRLLNLIVEAVLEGSDTAGLKSKPAKQSTDALAPNYVFSTPVPQEILDFFHQFAQDIISKDPRRIAQNYARGYDHTRDAFASPSRIMFGGGGSPPLLEYVHITKIRIEKNRAYLRGTLKFAFVSYAGSIGIFPLENLIKLKGRWRWLGLPEKTAVLDRDDYFDAELSEAQHQFFKQCSGFLVGKSSQFKTDCFAQNFASADDEYRFVIQRLHTFLQRNSKGNLHVTALQPNGHAYRLKGYIEDSALGDLSLPGGLQIVQKNGIWKYLAILDSCPAK